ncbi:unnamed protein product [Symbiodinium necroappetens]|uniref:Uncharacterized protein n=1 Tax=Symbiodinium necroappetens TaxID=1628268 RepID=A0A813CDT9_9DINO|nr:unnamed protein product [Symbiodinium necroappetens]
MVQEGLGDNSVRRINGNVKFLWEHCDVFPAADFSVFALDGLGKWQVWIKSCYLPFMVFC